MQEIAQLQLELTRILLSIDLNGRSRTLFGRLDTCNVRLEHPTVSRYHAVLQYKPNKVDGDIEEGFYLYDLGEKFVCLFICLLS